MRLIAAQSGVRNFHSPYQFISSGVEKQLSRLAHNQEITGASPVSATNQQNLQRLSLMRTHAGY